jgi:DNA-binding PadR family transcriptional regulator
VKARFGRFGETALWILVALREGPRNGARLLDDVRSLDGHVGPGTLYGAVARLERSSLIERTVNGDKRPAYRLTERGAATDASTLEGGVSR